MIQMYMVFTDNSELPVESEDGETVMTELQALGCVQEMRPRYPNEVFNVYALVKQEHM